MKRLYCFLFFFLLIFQSKIQAQNGKLTGKWKVVKVQFSKNVVFNLEDLTKSYQQFFNRQEQQVYKGKLSTNDSLFIQYQFEKSVNDINRMFIDFKSGNQYETNGFNKDGSPSEKKAAGIYQYNVQKNEISTYLNGNKNSAIRYKVISLEKSLLVINDTKSANPLILTFKRVYK